VPEGDHHQGDHRQEVQAGHREDHRLEAQVGHPEDRLLVARLLVVEVRPEDHQGHLEDHQEDPLEDLLEHQVVDRQEDLHQEDPQELEEQEAHHVVPHLVALLELPRAAPQEDPLEGQGDLLHEDLHLVRPDLDPHLVAPQPVCQEGLQVLHQAQEDHLQGAPPVVDLEAQLREFRLHVVLELLALRLVLHPPLRHSLIKR